MHRLLILVLILSVAGCVKQKADIEPGKYRNLAAVAMALGSIQSEGTVIPGPMPEPDSDKVVPMSECTECIDPDTGEPRGWLGDGQPRFDCPVCDSDGDGDAKEPLSNYTDFQQTVNLLNWKSLKEGIPEDNQKPVLVYFYNGDLAFPTTTELTEFLEDKFVTCSQDLSDKQLANKWAKLVPGSDLTIKDEEKHDFIAECYCILNPDGSFAQTPENRIYYPIESDEEILTNLQEILKQDQK